MNTWKDLPTWVYIVTIPLLIVFLLPFVLLIFGLLANWEQSIISFNFSSIIYNSLLFGALYLGLAIGLTLGYKILKFPNFAVGEYFLIGGYLTVYLASTRWFSTSNENPSSTILFWGLIVAFLGTGILAIVVDLLVFKPLRQRNASPQTLMITSLGVSLGLRALLIIRFGTGTYSIATSQNSADSIKIPTFLTKVDLSRLSISTVFTNDSGVLTHNFKPLDAMLILTIYGLAIVFFLFLKLSKYGKAMRAVASNKDLAASSGINVERINQLANFIIGGFAGMTGTFYVAKYAFDPADALYLLLPAFAVIVLGTVGSLIGAFVASILIGFSRAYSEPILSALQQPLERNFLSTYKEVVPFLVLILVLLFYTQGIGEKLEQKFNELSFTKLKNFFERSTDTEVSQ